MKPIFVKNEKELKYFIFGSNVKVEESENPGDAGKPKEIKKSTEFEDMDNPYRFEDIEVISEKLFMLHGTLDECILILNWKQ